MDATIISAAGSTKNKNKDKKRDPEMHQTCKGKQYYEVAAVKRSA